MSLAEIESEDFPGERLICCRNPLVAAERASKREDMLRATERALSGIERRVEQGTLSGRDQIALAAGAVWNRFRIKSSAGSRRAVRAVLCAAERFMRGAYATASDEQQERGLPVLLLDESGTAGLALACP